MPAHLRAPPANPHSKTPYREIIDCSREFIVLLAPDGTLLHANRTVLDFAGVSLDDVVGTHLWSAPWWFGGEKARAALRAAIGRGSAGETSRFEAVHSGSDGRTIVVDLTLTPVLDSDGGLGSLVAESRDITAHKATTEALRESEARFKSLLALSTDWYWQQDKHFRFIEFSETVKELAGVDAKAHLGKTRWDLPIVEMNQEAWAQHRTQLERHEPFRDFEYRRINESGEIVWVSTSGDPIFDADGQFTGYRGTSRNITSHKQSEDALHESGARLRLALEGAGIGLWDWDLSSNTVVWDKQQRELFDIAGAEGPVEAEQAFSKIHPEDRPRVEAAVADAVERRLLFREEFRVVHEDGTAHWLVGLGEALDNGEESQPGRLIGVNFDITDRREAEDTLRRSRDFTRRVLNDLFTFVGVMDLDGTLLQANRGPLEAAGIPASEVVGKKFWDCYWWNYDPDIRAQLMEAFAQARLGELVRYDVPVRMAGDSRMWIDFQLAPLRDEDGQVTHVIPSAMDLTARKEAEAALRSGEHRLTQANLTLEARVAERTEELAAEAERHLRTQTELALAQRVESVGQLAGGVAHDFNNLLAIIGGNLELAMQRITDNLAGEMIGNALEAVESGASLTQRLLSFARKRKLQPVRLVANHRVEETARLLERTLGADIAMTMVLDPDLWETFADPGEIDSALLNIAVNARDAMPDGGSLSIETQNLTLGKEEAQRVPDARAGDFIQLSVTDTGTGMTPDVLRHAIDPFFTTKEPGKGTGLGLSSVYGFANQSNGFITIDSHPGRGTRISIHLPRAAPQTNLRRGAFSSAEAPVGDGELILVVEDDKMVREVTRKRLEALGYDVFEASTGAEAIERLQAGDPVSLIFSDVVMPGGMSGHDLAAWAIDNRPDVKVVLTSGYNDPGRAGASPTLSKKMRILGKPYPMAKLARCIREALDSSET